MALGAEKELTLYCGLFDIDEVKKYTMNIIDLKLDQLHPYENNPRKNDEAVKYVAESIKEFGFKVPIVIDKNNVIIAGHTRYKAAKKLKLTEVPCIVADDLTEEQVKAFRLADNKVGELADLNMNMDVFGFEEFDIEDNAPDVEEDYYEPDPPNEPKSKPGDIFKLGEHFLMCGDSTKYEDVMKLLDNDTVDLVVTDPPYNVNYEGTAGKIENDNMSSVQFLEFLTDAFANIEAALKPGGAFYIWYASREHINFEQALINNNLQVREQLIWVKNSLVLSRQDYHWRHEPCLYGWKDGAAHYFVDDRSQTTVFEDKPDIEKMSKGEMKQLLKSIYEEDGISTSILHEAKPTSNDQHPTMKPIKLIGRLVANSSKKHEKVLDLFGGSGSTLIACEQLNRKSYTMEYDPKFVDVIIDRWEIFTGEKAVKLNE